MRRELTTSVLAVVIFTLALGLAYPLVMTGVGQVVWPNKADGSQVERNGDVVGSRLIGQDFQRPVLGPDGEPEQDDEGNPVLESDPRYFQSRPSVTGYSANVTYFNNLGPNNKELSDLFSENLADLPRARAPVQPRPPAQRMYRPMPSRRPRPAWTRTSQRRTRASRRDVWPRYVASRWIESSSSLTRTRTGAGWACSASPA